MSGRQSLEFPLGTDHIDEADLPERRHCNLGQTLNRLGKAACSDKSEIGAKEKCLLNSGLLKLRQEVIPLSLQLETFDERTQPRPNLGHGIEEGPIRPALSSVKELDHAGQMLFGANGKDERTLHAFTDDFFVATEMRRLGEVPETAGLV